MGNPIVDRSKILMVQTVDATGAPSSGGGGGGGGAVTIAEGAAVPIGATTDLSWDGAAPSATLVSLGKAVVDAIVATQGAFGGENAIQVVMIGPDGAPIDFTESVNALPQFEINPDGITRTPVNISGADTDVVLALDAGKRHVVTKLLLNFSGAANVSFTNSGSTITLPVVAGETWIIDHDPSGHFVTNVGEAFSIGKSTNITITGMVYSAKVD